MDTVFTKILPIWEWNHANPIIIQQREIENWTEVHNYYNTSNSNVYIHIYFRSNFYKCSTNQIIFPFIFIICSLIYICMTECLWYVSILWLLTELSYTTILWCSFLSNCFSIHDNKLWMWMCVIDPVLYSYFFSWMATN